MAVRVEAERTVKVPAGKIPCYRIGLEATPISKHSKRRAEDFEGPLGLRGKIEIYLGKKTRQLVLVQGEIAFGVTFKVNIMLAERSVETF